MKYNIGDKLYSEKYAKTIEIIKITDGGLYDTFDEYFTKDFLAKHYHPVQDKRTKECTSLDYKYEYNRLREELGEITSKLSIALDIINKLGMLLK